MASPNTWLGGLGLTGTVFENVPDSLASTVTLSGAVQFLDTINGNDASAGTTPFLAVKTFAQALTNSAANGLIIIGEGSAETLSGSQALSLAGLSIIGCGSGSTRPRYTCSGAVVFFNVSGTGFYLENLYFPASTAAPTARIDLTAGGGYVKDCYFECGASDTNRTIRVPAGGTNARLEGCTFAVTASRPAIAVELSGATNDVWAVDCTFDGGSYGWSDYAFKISAAALRTTLVNPSLVGASYIGATITGTSYKVLGTSAGGTNKVFFTA